MLNQEHEILEDLCKLWGIDSSQIVPSAKRFFKESKQLSAQTQKQNLQILKLQIKCALKDDAPLYVARSDQPDPTIYFSFLPQYAEQLQQKGKGIVFVGSNFVIGLLGNP